LNRPNAQRRLIQRALALVAVLFGIATIVAGGRVLAGSDPGYIVFRPLLIFNTAMGLAYVIGGVVAWRSSKPGAYVAAVIFCLNCAVLVMIGYLYETRDVVAVESLRAMTLRTVVWLALFLGLGWVSRAESSKGTNP
jgi:hypothetical protein